MGSKKEGPMTTAVIDSVEKVIDFINFFSDEIGEHIEGDFDGETYIFDVEHFFLSFSVDDEDRFIIHNLECRTEGIGVGKRVVNAIHSFADEQRLTVVAHKVKDGCRGFWQKLGYEEGTCEEFFRVR